MSTVQIDRRLNSGALALTCCNCGMLIILFVITYLVVSRGSGKTTYILRWSCGCILMGSFLSVCLAREPFLIRSLSATSDHTL